ncbi:hypothetical protein FSP39_006799 [Pinctada imbricata]|uniref:Glutamyl-tRNA(Gln) amidotransferase subunit B, mitochondrial n=1 Tax=Pinctada imbricata TaxID=66713 RepID=A0AA88Y7Q1_PINIB|nr:hypothetical protein FSP39_006799 [Pinctada imbricata]
MDHKLVRYPLPDCSIHFEESQKEGKEKRGKWKPVIGLEIHAQIKTDSKLFSRSGTSFSTPVNCQVSFFDAALPGTLPVLNRSCVEAGVRTALALKSNINKVSKFDRKHYFYADLPQGYQITQQRMPLAVGGKVDYAIVDESTQKEIGQGTARITQIQLEQDSGKSLHDEEEKRSLIDLNRAGIGLMEIVTEPDFSNGLEAHSFVSELRLILRSLGTCSGKMKEGALRVDANISVHQEGEPLGTRTEVKNIGNIKAIKAAVDYEIQRQIAILEEGGTIENETRSYDGLTGTTLPMRDKELKMDYRFMPEPNLPPVRLYDSETISKVADPSSVIDIDKFRSSIPPLPKQVKENLQKEYKISLFQANMLFGIVGLYDLFHDILEQPNKSLYRVLNFLLHDLHGAYKTRNISFEDGPMTLEHAAELIDMIEEKVTNHALAKKILVEYIDGNERISPRIIAEKKNLTMINDIEILTEACKKSMDKNPAMVKTYSKGKVGAIKALIGDAMEFTDNRASRIVITEIMESLLPQVEKKKRKEKKLKD